MTEDMFGHDRMDDGGEKFSQHRMNTKPLMSPNEWRPLVVEYVYNKGPQGVTIGTLMKVGVLKEWWQPSVAKHVGEKMRVVFSTAMVFVAPAAGITSTDHIRLVHPAFVDVVFNNAVLERDNQRVRRHMMRLNYVDQKK